MKLKVIEPKKVKIAKRAQTIRLAILTLIFIIVVSSAVIYIAVSETGRQSACRQIAVEVGRDC